MFRKHQAELKQCWPPTLTQCPLTAGQNGSRGRGDAHSAISVEIPWSCVPQKGSQHAIQWVPSCIHPFPISTEKKTLYCHCYGSRACKTEWLLNAILWEKGCKWDSLHLHIAGSVLNVLKGCSMGHHFFAQTAMSLRELTQSRDRHNLSVRNKFQFSMILFPLEEISLFNSRK